VPDHDVAFPDCAAARGRHCSFAAHGVGGGLGGGDSAFGLAEGPALGRVRARAAHFDCAAGAFLTRPELAATAEAQDGAAADRGQCPSPNAASLRTGTAGFVWSPRPRSTPRAALSAHYCELPAL
jgi:hypothetical protein